ncbi:MAG TPA: type I restriction-modification system subunit M [Cyclobacteriaceae bacterium]|nr:type I restriction-modification system subunit M [Cyclobacteriaceae bacterium]HMV08165.1 type I restriction-modification system subunit M [Cyclobacteriaceae bacterium]HMX00806.1 type I restriction-modification system subunit M [Cyclobacteriaceae bacterium]HMX49319.1 type I restriction-modification system subunit M [Cyclobacteriaceae bacterium]HMY93609.1 type I restriction-modification system subunit M [Cyclobacteriaceae bacterium]
MAIKKSELYSSLWASCDELRGGMDASQYKDYVLVMLFIKYISDKYAGIPYAPITVPKGASFKDMVELKGKPSIGDDINKKIIGPIENANKSLGKIDVDFDNPDKLGSGDEKVKRLSNLIAIFENPELDFSKNRAEGDDILGDAYEYLMRHFATDSGKSKGQFYTPAEVSRVIAKIIGISQETGKVTVYDPTCGSGSLLLRVAAEAEKKVDIYGQEKDISTAALSRMNMILHNHPIAEIKCNGNSTLSSPLFLDDKSGLLRQFDYVVANPPFSTKSWSSGVDPINDIHRRFQDFGTPPEKNGDYAFLLHIVRSMKSKGKGAVILPHGVLFRGNTEAGIREKLIKKGYIKGIIGLAANLFYGTGIPACLIILDKEEAEIRKGIFMIDASKDFVKDGNKNRLREQDIHKIVDVFTRQLPVPKYSRLVPIKEIASEKNDYNLNIPRYIDSQEAEDIQDIEAHLLGGIPNVDIDALEKYWKVYPSLKEVLFGKTKRKHYSKLNIAEADIKQTIFTHPEFTAYSKKVNTVFTKWRNRNTEILKNIKMGVKPKKLIYELSEDILDSFSNLSLINNYDVYQYLMAYWLETMQDDVYEIAIDGWKVGGQVYRITKETKDKNGKVKVKEIEGIDGIESKLLKPALLIDMYFKALKENIEQHEAERDSFTAQLEELEEEHIGEEGFFADYDKVNKASVQKRLKEIKEDKAYKEEIKILEKYLDLVDEKGSIEKILKELQRELEKLVWEKYGKLTVEEIKTLVVDDKWMTTLHLGIQNEMQRVSQRLTQRIKELASRYEIPMPELLEGVVELEAKVFHHLKGIGYSWN